MSGHASKPAGGGQLRRRRQAARQMWELAPYAGWPLLGVTVLVHLVAGSAPVAFLAGTSMALPGILAGDLPWGLWVAVGAFVLQQALAPLQLVLSREIARRVDAACLTRLTRFTLHEATLAGLERPEVADRLHHVDESFEQWTLTPGAALEGGVALTARYTQLVGVVLLIGWAVGPWAAVAGAFVALVARTGQAEAFHRWGGLVGTFQPLRRRLAYVRELATSTRAAKEIRMLGLAGWLDERYRAETAAVLGPTWTWRRRVYGRPFLAYATAALLGSVAALLVVAGGESGQVADGRLVAVSVAVQGIVLCGRFGVMFPESDVKLVYGRSAYRALCELEESVREAGAGERPSASPAERTGAERTGADLAGPIRFDRVTFGYVPDSPVLDAVDLTLLEGTSTALIGVNGAGKTTLVKVLAGIYTPDDGSVQVGGVDLRTVDLDEWQQRFAVSFQDFLRYELPLRDNVAMGAIEHRDDDAGILEALDRVGLSGLVDDLPRRLETALTRSVSGGRDLSGGQWQRVALARALFAVRHGASVLVLDEPTAQLDARAEAEFYETFLDLTRGVTSLIISHRFSTVRQADRIIVLDGGTVVEAGSHAELMALGGRYHQMFSVQARRFGTADEEPHVMANEGSL